MTSSNRTHWQNRNEVLDPPAPRHKVGTRKYYHSNNTQQRKRERPLEAFHHLGHLDEEVTRFCCLGRRAPRHVDLEHVGQERGADVQTQPAEEDG